MEGQFHQCERNDGQNSAGDRVQNEMVPGNGDGQEGDYRVEYADNSEPTFECPNEQHAKNNRPTKVQAWHGRLGIIKRRHFRASVEGRSQYLNRVDKIFGNVKGRSDWEQHEDRQGKDQVDYHHTPVVIIPGAIDYVERSAGRYDYRPVGKDVGPIKQCRKAFNIGQDPGLPIRFPKEPQGFFQ